LSRKRRCERAGKLVAANFVSKGSYYDIPSTTHD
jgi:hypothetical protein